MEDASTKQAGVATTNALIIGGGIALVAMLVSSQAPTHYPNCPMSWWMAYRIKQYTKNQAARGEREAVKGEQKNRCVQQGGCKNCKCGRDRVQWLPDFHGIREERKSAQGNCAKRRKAYKTRHDKDRKKRGTNGWYADKLCGKFPILAKNYWIMSMRDKRRCKPVRWRHNVCAHGRVQRFWRTQSPCLVHRGRVQDFKSPQVDSHPRQALPRRSSEHGKQINSFI